MAGKRDFGDLAKLTGLASQFPTQNVQPEPVAQAAPAAPKLRAVAKPAPVPAVADAELVKFTFDLTEAQRDQLQQLARKEKLTTRAFILTALRDRGLDVAESDLADRRKTRHA